MIIKPFIPPFIILLTFALGCGGVTPDETPDDTTEACDDDLPELDAEPVDIEGYEEEVYDGPLYETSFQLGDGTSVDFDTVLELMNQNNIVRTRANFGVDANDELDLEGDGDEGLGFIEEAVVAAPCRIVPFFVEGSGDVSSLDTGNIETVLDAAEERFETQILRGIGELEFYKQDWGSLDTDDPLLTAVYEIASDNEMGIFGHWAGSPDSIGPEGTDPWRDANIMDSLENALASFPEIIFLFHLFPNDIEEPDPDGDDVWDLMDIHDNFYFSVDVDHIMQQIPWMCGLLDCYENDSDAAAQFVAYYDAHFQEMLDQAVERYADIIEAHPDRFMWGMENVGDYSFEEEVFNRSIEFSRAFIGLLNQSVREKIAYRNAERVYGPGAILP